MKAANLIKFFVKESYDEYRKEGRDTRLPVGWQKR
jgi:hypothetical protein